MLRTLGKRAEAWARATDPWSNVYGLARSLLALSSAATLLFSPTGALFRPLVNRADYPYCEGFSELSLYCVPGLGSVEVRHWIAFAVLLVIASGWRPRWTALPHWWVAISFPASATMVDGGDQVASILSLLLLPVALLDGRRWHWSGAGDADGAARIEARLVALSALVAIRLQVAGIYFHAFLGKFAVTEWVDGTVLYYWTRHPNFGAPGWLEPVVAPLVTHPFGVVALTWSQHVVGDLPVHRPGDGQAGLEDPVDPRNRLPRRHRSDPRPGQLLYRDDRGPDPLPPALLRALRVELRQAPPPAHRLMPHLSPDLLSGSSAPGGVSPQAHRLGSARLGDLLRRHARQRRRRGGSG